MQKEKQKNNIKFFQCHQIPVNLEIKLNKFLDSLTKDGTFLVLLENLENKIEFIEINFLNSKEITNLNKKYRNINNSTDVLSFNLINIGEIDLCVKNIKINSKEFNIDFFEELKRCIIHGCLHIIGYDHNEKLTPGIVHSEPMFLIQEKILSNVSSSSL